MKAAEEYVTASNIEINELQKKAYRKDAATAYADAAGAYLNAGKRAAARKAVRDGRQYAEPGTKLRQTLEKMYEDLR
jgi:hypothetical protein